MITTSDEIADALRRNLRTLTADLAAWRVLSQEPFWRSHVTQIARLERVVAGFAGEIDGQISRLPTANVDGARRLGGDINRRILQAHEFWDYFRSKLSARTAPGMHDYLRVADEFAWRCFKACRDARKMGLQDGEAVELVAKSPPLIFLGAQVSPFVLLRDRPSNIKGIGESMFTSILAKAPLSVMGLPYYQTADLPSALVIGHEMGHVVEFDSALGAALDREVKALELPAEEEAYWLEVRVEAFADAFGTLAGGCAFLPVLAKFIAREKAWVSSERLVKEPPRFSYPTIYLRVLLCHEVLKLSYGDELPTHARDFLNSWKETYGTDHVYQEYEGNLQAVARALVGTNLPELGGKSFREVVGLTAKDEGDVTRTHNDLLLGSIPGAGDPRVLMAGAAAAYHADRARYTARTEAIALHTILRNCEDGTRGRETQEEKELQEKADRKTAAMLLKDPEQGPAADSGF